MQTRFLLNEPQQKQTYYANKYPQLHLRPNSCLVSHELYFSAYYCPHCGAELYMHWDWAREYRDYRKYESLPYPDSLNDEKVKKHEEEVARYDNQLLAYNEEIYADRDAMEREAKEFSEVKTCFVCGGALRHKPGYFIQTDNSGSDFDFFGGDNPCCASSYYGYERLNNDNELLDLNWEKGKETLNVDNILSYMQSVRVPLEVQLSENKVAAFTQKVDIPSLQSVSANIASSIKSDPAKLQEYLQLLVHMESDIYALTKQLGNLYLHKQDADRPVLFQSTYPAVKVRTEIEKEIAHTKTMRARLSASLQELKDAPLPKVQLNWPVSPNPPILEKPGLFNKKKVAERNAARTAHYESALAAYKLDYEKCKQKEAQLIAKNNDQRNRNIQAKQDELDKLTAKYNQLQAQKRKKVAIANVENTPEFAVQNMLQKEIDEAEQLLKQFYETRNSLYAYNVVFPKYRNLVALSTFCEYMVTGRCSALDGASGIYNLYESECRADMIISQLNVVIESLEQIKQNQYMLYKQLQNINATLYSLNNTMEAAVSSIRNIEDNTASMGKKMDKIVESTAVTAHNSAVTAYYSKLNAELTSALVYMVAFS